MTADVGYSIWIGGPMSIGNGYRWNVPVVTYGFDPSFVEYFGSNGVADVESAIQILNDLPPASAINLSDYPLLFTTRINYRAYETNLINLKSAALGFMLEHMGLGPPTIFGASLRAFTDPTHYTVVTNNLDPVDLTPSPYVNGALFRYGVQYTVTPAGYSAFEYAVAFNGGEDEFSVADFGITVGTFYTGLSFDDLGGLRYLLATNNVALESLIPGVAGRGANASNYVVTALRPGVDKITFVRLDYDTIQGRFAAITNQYMDSFLTNNAIQQQTLQRVITQPDILFTAQDLGLSYYITESDTSTWVNNGSPGSEGPGVIQPPIAMNFNRLGPNLVHYSGTDYSSSNLQVWNPTWGSYDTNTTPPLVYSGNPAGTNSTIFHFWLSSNPSIYSFVPVLHSAWTLPGHQNDQFQLQTSTNFSDWTAVATVTNLGGTFNYFDFVENNATQRYFRTVKQ